MLTIVLSRGIEIPRAEIPPSLDEQLRERFSHTNPKRILLEKLGKWAGAEPKLIEHFDATEDRLVLPRGGTTAVAELLDRSGIPWEVADRRVSFPEVEFPLKKAAKDIELRGYQYQAIDAAIRGENCLVRSATGSGKTEIALELIRNLKQPTLVIVWTASLLAQWVERIVDRWGWDPTEIGVVGSGKKRPGKLITIALQQSLSRDLYGLDQRVGALIVDECFEASTPVLMADGTLRPIDRINVGDEVAVGGRVTATGSRWYEGRSFVLNGSVLTPNHELAADAWILASEVTDEDFLWYDPLHVERTTLRDLSEADEESLPRLGPSSMRPTGVLDRRNLHEMRLEDRGLSSRRAFGIVSWDRLEQGADEGHERDASSYGGSTARSKTTGDRKAGTREIPRFGVSSEAFGCGQPGSDDTLSGSDSTRSVEGAGASTDRGRANRTVWWEEPRERPGTDRRRDRNGTTSRRLRVRSELRSGDEDSARTGISDSLQDRSSQPCDVDSDRDRWEQSFAGQERDRRTQDLVPRVEEVAGISLPGSVRLRRRRAMLHRSIEVACRVYNLTTEHGVYVAAGTLVHNCQRASSRTFREVIDAFPAKYRMGFSADERRKDGLEFLTRESFGSIVAEISKDTLVDAGHLCEVEIVLVPTASTHPAVENAADEDRRTVVREMYGEITKALETDDQRNDLVRSLAVRAVKEGRSTLIFCNRIAQARELARKLVVLDEVGTGLMLGGIENRDEFEHTKTRMKSGDLLCAVGSSATYQGEDIPRLSVGVLVTPLASNRQLFEQVVGRLRRKYPGKVRGRLYVVWDEKLFPHHADNLRKWYGARLVKRFEDLR